MFNLVYARKIKVRNWVTGRWVLTLKRDKDGSFLKTKARWVLRGLQDSKRTNSRQTEFCCIQEWFLLGNTSSRKQRLEHLSHGYRNCLPRMKGWMQERRTIKIVTSSVRSLLKWDIRHTSRHCSRRWCNIPDSALRSDGLVPARADRCTYVYYVKHLPKSTPMKRNHQMYST